MILSNVRRKDLAALSKTALVETLWTIAKQADDAGMMFGHGQSYEHRRDLCVISPGQVLDLLEEVTGR